MTKDQWELGCVIAGNSIPAKAALFSVEIWFAPWYDDAGNRTNEFERWYIHNQCWVEINFLREKLFTHGFFLERAPGRGEIIFPSDFRKILIDIQPKGFKDSA